MRKKSKKPVGGVFSSQDWSQKKPLAKINLFLEKVHFAETPPNSKNMGAMSEKQEFTNIFTRFSNLDSGLSFTFHCFSLQS